MRRKILKNNVFIYRHHLIMSTDHEMIPVKNASVAAMHGSASVSNVRYYPT
jgi:hypothetical protein